MIYEMRTVLFGDKINPEETTRFCAVFSVNVEWLEKNRIMKDVSICTKKYACHMRLVWTSSMVYLISSFCVFPVSAQKSY